MGLVLIEAKWPVVKVGAVQILRRNRMKSQGVSGGTAPIRLTPLMAAMKFNFALILHKIFKRENVSV